MLACWHYRDYVTALRGNRAASYAYSLVTSLVYPLAFSDHFCYPFLAPLRRPALGCLLRNISQQLVALPIYGATSCLCCLNVQAAEEYGNFWVFVNGAQLPVSVASTLSATWRYSSRPVSRNHCPAHLAVSFARNRRPIYVCPVLSRSLVRALI